MDAPFSPGAPDAIAALRAALHGRYEFERELGQGAFATVYLARDLKHERKVAIKVLNADPSSDTGELRFIREIRMLARLQHPNILPLHDSGHVEALLYYVMPYVRGDTLRDHLTRVRQMPVRDASVIARDVADALAYAHGEGIIHRDIKPENILMSTGHPMVADFGIARVIDLVGAKQLTRTGMGSPGTPAYMSPEQLLGEREIDGRSDTYSLGCVLYEMLTGKPPFAGKEGFVKRFTEPPPSVRTIRAEVGAELDVIVMKMLQREPRDRFQTALDLVEALRAIDSGGISNTATAAAVAAAKSPVRGAQTYPVAQSYQDAEIEDSPLSTVANGEPIARTRKILPALLALCAVMILVIAALASASFRDRFRSRQASTSDGSERIVVLPLSAQDTTVGTAVAEHIYDALHAWTDLSLVPDTKVAEALTRGASPATEDAAIALARSLGASKLIWGRVTGRGAGARIGVHLFDVASGTSRKELVARDPGDGEQAFQPLVLQLLKPANWPERANDGDGLTSSYAAWSAYGRGHAAILGGNLDDADREFSAALASDAEYSVAHLWLAQLREWRAPAAKSSWRDHALRASASSQLNSRDRVLASALVAIADGAYPAACNQYRRLTLTDSSDFVGWYGLGECQALDSLVIPSSVSPSQWAFRSSNLAAVSAYERALRLSPAMRSIFNFARLESLLPTAPTRVRLGVSASPERAPFMASPALMGPNETLAFVPYPARAFSERPAIATATLSAAIAKNSDRLLDYVVQWTSTAKSDAAAFEALADVLDVRGEIGDGRDPRASALSALRKARSLTTDSAQIIRVTAKEAWVHFKRSEFSEAKRLADTVLFSHTSVRNADPAILVGLAALTGRVRMTAQLSDLSNTALPASLNDLASPLRTAASEFFARSALGSCATAISSRATLDHAIDRYVAPASTATVKRTILARPLNMLVPCTGGRSILEIAAPTDRISRLQKAFAEGNKRKYQAIADSIEVRVQNRRPGDLSPDFVFQRAWLRAASGDTIGAIGQLDRSLGALAGLNGSALREPGSAAAVIRAMVLRADLAAATGDHAAARKWSTAVKTLWADADAELAPTVARMRALASSGS